MSENNNLEVSNLNWEVNTWLKYTQQTEENVKWDNINDWTNSNKSNFFGNSSFNINNFDDASHIRMMWLLNLLSFLTLWIWLVFVILYFFFKESDFWKDAKNSFYFMLNFFASYAIYMFFSLILIFVLIWIVTSIILWIIIAILAIVWFIYHMKWEPYEYFWSIRFFKPIE